MTMPSAEEKRGQLVAAFASAAGTSSQDAHAFVGEQIQSVTLPSGAKEGDHWVFHWKVGPGTNSIPKTVKELVRRFRNSKKQREPRSVGRPKRLGEEEAPSSSGRPKAAAPPLALPQAPPMLPHVGARLKSTQLTAVLAPSVFQVMAYIEEVSSLEEAAAAREDYETASHLNALVKQLQATRKEVAELEAQKAISRKDKEYAAAGGLKEKIAQLCGAASEIYNKKQNAPENSVQDTASRDHQGGAKKDGGGAEGLQMEVEGGVMH